MFEKIKKQLVESVWNSEQMLQLRQRFAEFDGQTQSYLLIGGFAFFLITLVGSLLYLGLSNHSLQLQVDDTNASIRFLQGSADKMEEVRAKIRAQSLDPNLREFSRDLALGAFAEKAAQKASIDKDSFEITNEKQSPPAKGRVENSLEAHLNKISIKQLARLLYYLEQTQSGIEVQKLAIDSKEDPSGYLWAVLDLHRFSEPKKGR